MRNSLASEIMVNEKVVYYKNGTESPTVATTTVNHGATTSGGRTADIDDVYILTDERSIGQMKKEAAASASNGNNDFEAVYYTDLRAIPVSNQERIVVIQREEEEETLLESLTLFAIFFAIAYMSYLLLIQNNYDLNDNVNFANVLNNMWPSNVPSVDPAVSDINANYSSKTPRGTICIYCLICIYLWLNID